MQGLSFREYLGLFHQINVETFSLDDILQHKVALSSLPHPLPLFKEYLKRGYYPFAQEDDFDLLLRQIINQTLENDIPMFADMHVATGRKLKQLLTIISKSTPFVADFLVGSSTFEVGGKNKGSKQIRAVKNAFVVKDDIERGYLNTVPLWQFGLTY